MRRRAVGVGLAPINRERLLASGSVRESARVPGSRKAARSESPRTLVAVVGIALLASCSLPVMARPTIEELKARSYLDDYESNVVYGYNIVMDTGRYAARYAGNRLRCSNCHLNGGTTPDALPLNVAGIYPKWRSKNGVRNGVELRIRECFVYSHNGVMPPADAPEVLAVAAYISYLSEGEVMGRPPAHWGVPTLPDTGMDPNPARGEAVYKRVCALCHGPEGQGMDSVPPLWGPDSYNAGAGMHSIQKAGGFIWANMPPGNERSLTHQEALDAAAFLHTQLRPFDPREGRLKKLFEQIIHRLNALTGKGER